MTNPSATADDTRLLVLRALLPARDPDRRAADLIAACAHVLATAGARGATVRAICDRAGVSPGLLRHYFSGLGALIAATYVHVAQGVTRALADAMEAAGTDPQARLIAYVTASFRPPIAAPELLATWAAFWSLVRSDPAIASLHTEVYAGYRDALQKLLMAAGVSPADAPQAAVAITALVDGLWLELSMETSAFTADDANIIARRWLASWLPAQIAT